MTREMIDPSINQQQLLDFKGLKAARSFHLENGATATISSKTRALSCILNFNIPAERPEWITPRGQFLRVQVDIS